MSNIWKERIDKLTYGLVYPAFFGNMVYNLILFKKDFVDKGHLIIDFSSAIAVVLFFIVDYIHLHADMNEIVKPLYRKSHKYLFCDIGTSLISFISFIGIIEANWWLPFLGIGIIPFVISIYKKKNKPSNKFFNWYKGISILILLAIIIDGLTSNLLTEQLHFILLGFICVSLIFYVWYVFIYYPGKPREFDINFIKKNKEEY